VEKRAWDDIRVEKVNENITRKMFWGQNIMVTKWELAPDTQIPVHDHVSEQVTMVERGSVTLCFPDVEEVTLNDGEMLIIPSSKPHGARVGSEGCTVMDFFSPIRKDLIEVATAYCSGTDSSEEKGVAGHAGVQERDPYDQLNGFLSSVGVKVPIEKLREVPLEILARYSYEKECITMGQLRGVLGLDKQQAKQLLRKWKHGDDHSESSYRRSLERMIIFPEGIKVWRPK